MKKMPVWFVVAALFLSQITPAFAQLDTAAPTTDTTAVEETITPPPDTTGPGFISVATAAAEETEVNVIWTTDEPAYGFVQYGPTNTYGLATPKSSSASLDHTVSITGLTPGTTYHYRIVAEDEHGNISYSQDRTFETAIEAVVIDNIPPGISQVSATNITTSAATIGWLTDELARGRVEYGKTASYGSATPLTPDYATEHSAALTGLDPNTEYHYRVVVLDESGNEAVSPDELFTTDALTEIPPPEEENTEEPVATTTPTTATTTETVEPAEPTEPEPAATTTGSTAPFAISHVETSSVGTSTATIIWKTNEPASAQVFYGQSDAYASSSPLSAGNAVDHEIKLTGLKPGVNYFYKVVSKNNAGRAAEKAKQEFNTLFVPKVAIVKPAISNLRVESIGTSNATVLFNTNVPTTGRIGYGTTTSYGQSDMEHLVLLTEHSHPLSGLAPNTTYNFTAIVRDAQGNEAIYENQTFTTLADSSAASVPAASTTTEPAEPVTDATTVAPARGGGGAYYSYTFTTTLKEPKLTKVDGLDGQAMFVWDPHKPVKAPPGATQIMTNVLIVRSPVRYPDGPTFGKIVYKGNSGLFTDTGLENGKTYYYSVFIGNQFNSHSRPGRYKVTPTGANEEMELEAVPSVVQKNPIYTFPETLRLGDQGKQVAHLQVLLASELSIYPQRRITGYFGALTEKAVREFQKRRQLNMTGIADAATRKKLEQLSAVEVVQDKAATYGDAFSRELKLGDRGGDVAVLQQFLINAGVYPEELVTGYFGSLTQAALSRFQAEQSIAPAGGYFGPITKERMLNLIRLREVSL